MTDTVREHHIELAFADGTAARWSVGSDELKLAADLIETELDAPGMASSAEAPRPRADADAGYVELTRDEGSVRHWAVTEEEADNLAELLEDRVGTAETLIC